MDDKEIQNKFKEFEKLAQENKQVDVAALMVSALEQQHQNLTSAAQKRWGYLISVGLPPLGLLFALKFYFSDKDDGKRAAWICIILTVVSVLLFFLIIQIMFTSTGTTIDQFQQLPAQYKSLIAP